LLAVKVLAANGSDQYGAKEVLTALKDTFPRLHHLWGDSAYAGRLIDWVRSTLGWTLEIVKGIKVEQPDVSQMHPAQILLLWDQLFAPRFRPQPKRWVIERSIAWIVRWRRLCRDHEGLPETSEAFIKLSACRRILSRLSPPFPKLIES
jgi:putative transposase